MNAADLLNARLVFGVFEDLLRRCDTQMQSRRVAFEEDL